MVSPKTRLQAWASDGPLRNVAKFGLIVMAGKFGAALFGLLTMVILARNLGVKAFGTLAVLRTYVFVVDHFVNFQSWQGFIKLGSDALAAGDKRAFLDLTKFTFLLDSGTAIFGAIAAALGAGVAARIFGWEPGTVWLAQIYAVGIAFRVSGISEGIFRVFDLYRVPAIVNTVAAGIVATALFAVSLDVLTLERAVFVLLIGESATFLLLLLLAFAALRKRGFGQWLSGSATKAQEHFKGIWSFFIATNLQGSLKKVRADADIVVIGAVLGDAPAGLFRVAKQIAVIPAKLVNPFGQVVYTELAKQVSSGAGRAYRQLLKRVVAIMVVIGFVTWVIGSLFSEYLVVWTAGADYVEAIPVLIVYLAATALSFVAMPLQRGLVAEGRPEQLLRVSIINTLIYFALLVWMTIQFGLLGAAAAFVIHRAVFTIWLGVLNTLHTR